MRITYRMMTSKYSTNLNSLSVQLDKLNTQVASGRKYARSSEDVSSAVRGYQIRRSLAKLEGYQGNITHAQGFLTNTESTLGQMEDSLSEAVDKVLYGMNGIKTVEDRTIIAKELETIQTQLLETLNTSVSDQYLFGGTNDQKPFKLDAAGKLMYNGTLVDSITDGSAELDALKKDTMYVDIGLGVAFDDATGDLDRSSVYHYSLPGIGFVGNGVDSTTGVSNNLYDLIGEIAKEFRKDDSTYSHDKTDSLLGLLKKNVQKVYQATTEVGAKTNYLDFMTSRYETQNDNLLERQTKVEGVDAAYVYIEFQTQKVAYQAALEMGTKVVQQSVFDYMS